MANEGLQLDVVTRIINVHWTDPDIVILYGLKGGAQFFIKFLTNRLPDAPEFGKQTDIPTDTKPVEPTPGFPVNNTVLAVGATIFISSRAIIHAYLQHFEGEESAVTLTGDAEYFNRKGESISVDDIKALPAGHKGKAVFTEQQEVSEESEQPKPSVVYAQYAGSGGDGRIYKVDSEGGTEWTIDGTPETVNVKQADDEDSDAQIISPGQEENDEINFYNPEDGELVSSKTLDENIQDVSRKGKIYTFTEGDDETWPGIKGYDREGASLFTIDGESIDNGTRFDSITAYGEKFIVVTGQFPQTNEFSFSVIESDEILGDRTLTTTRSTIPKWVIVFDAETGSQVSKTLWGNEVTTVNVDGRPAPGDNQSSIERESYASVLCVRTIHLPERPEGE